MSVYFDRQETQTSKSRDTALFRDLKGILSFAKGRAPTLRDQLRGVDLSKLRTRADLARIPLLRKSDLLRLQSERPPLGGLVARRPGALKGILVAPGPLCLPEGHAKDWWRAARAMHAAGFERENIIVNGFDDGAGARIVESGAHALSCAVAHFKEDEDANLRIEAIQRFGAAVYCGPAERLDRLIAVYHKRKLGEFPIRKALCFGGASNAEREDRIRLHRVDVHACYATDELGVIGYETKMKDGARTEDLVVNEGLIVEIVKPGGDELLPFGAVGEIVVTRLDSEFPLLRFATGDLSALLPGPSPCGRTNLRLRRPIASAEARAPSRRSRSTRISAGVDLSAAACRTSDIPPKRSWVADA